MSSYSLIILKEISESNGIEYTSLYADGLQSVFIDSEVIELTKRKFISVSGELLFITKEGEMYLEKHHLALDRLPTNIPQTSEPPTQNNKYHIGTWIVRMLQNDWFKLFITALLALILGTWLLVKFKVIK
jgi:hypothetical protein